nr:acyltransferase [uncultured Mucilaginibacter sp.]
MADKGGNIESVTLLRGIAALGVCIVHFYVANQVVYSPPVARIFFMGQLGVTIFFVLSGFILPYSLYRKGYSISDFPKFLLKRSIRIDPPYWATIILLFVFKILPLQVLSLKVILLHVFYLVPFAEGAPWFNGIFWTLAIEFQYYVLLGLLFPLLIKIRPLLSLAIVLLASVACVFMNFETRELIFASLHNFAVGYIVFLYFAGKVSLGQAIGVLLAFCAFLAFKVSITTGLVPAITALFLLLYKSKSPKVLLFLGNISYSLYLMHIIFMYLWLHFIKSYINNAFVLGITSMGVGIGAAYVFYLLIEKPSLKLSKKIGLNDKR